MHFINEKYVWFFENLEKSPFTFKATFTFFLENLYIEGVNLKNKEDANSFKIEIKPGQQAMRSIARKNPMVESKYKCTYTFVIDGWTDKNHGEFINKGISVEHV